MSALRNLWAQRAPRERLWIAAGGALVGAALIFLLAIEPAWVGTQRLERSLPATRAASAQLDALLAEARSLRERPAVAVAAGDWRALIEQSASRAGLKPTRLAAGAEGEWQLAFTGVPYAAWSTWLAEFERASGAKVVAVRARAAATPGSADIELSLRAPRP